ncbi:MAG: bifunctional phosphoribosyl-AMP cyclohydrolase/phosphoribosyl-ATP diphosphatase HisIE [Myxococcales bacterium]|nr:bifunctional phosphoribosyl-AMP cyclohydrolase/phosphoribosyl-ATP diphosphatase HisIE [Myxococcales bacterium]
MSLVDAVRWDDRGLLPAVVQDRLGGRVLMVAWMDRAALLATLETRKATFFSRSRNRQWVKGETSGHTLEVHDVRLDCDGDTLLVLATPAGPTCHTGSPTCFFQGEAEESAVGRPLLDDLEAEVLSRKASDAGKSYTKSLLDGGAEKIGGKLREEADELARAIAGESSDRVASEAADVLYHLMVGLASRDVPLSAVLAVLAARRGTSGHAEKASRGG